MPESVKWSRGRKAEFSSWLQSELFNTLGDRGTLETQWARQIQQYDAPRRGSADFPFPGASNEEVPLTAMHSEPVIANEMQALHATKNFWSVIDLSGEYTDRVNPLSEYLQIIDNLYLKMRSVNRRAIPEQVILGTAVWHPTWVWNQKKIRKYDEDGKVVPTVVIEDRPVVRHINLGDFLWPANAWDLDPDAATAPAQWCGHRFKVTENKLRQMGKGQAPFMPNFDPDVLRDVLDRETQEETQPQAEVRATDNYRPSRDFKIELFRIEARFDVDGDGIDEDIIVIFHYKTASILQAIHNPWDHGKRLYEVEQYIQTFSLLGKGIASMNEWAQAVISKLLNAQVDNAVLANTRMFGIPEGYSHYKSGEPIYPGKVWPLAQGEQIQEVKLSDAYDSMFEIMGAVQQMAESHTSVSELRTGNISGLPSRTPATTVLSMLAEGNKKFDMILSNMRTGAMANIGKRVIQMIAQRHQQGSPQWAQLATRKLGAEDAAAVISILDDPAATIEEGLGFEITTTSSQVNKEVEKQNMIGLGQFYGQSAAQLIQAAQMTQDQQLMVSTAMGFYSGGIELMKRIFEAYDIQNPERYLPQQPQQGQQQQGQQQPAVQPGPMGGRFGPSPFAAGAPQLGALLGLGFG